MNELPRVKGETWRYALDRAREEMAAYCVPTIGDNIRRLGGLSPKTASCRGTSKLTLRRHRSSGCLTTSLVEVRAGWNYRSNHGQFDLLKVDSAEKPPLVKKRHLKTPPKGGARFENVAHIESWSEKFSANFARSRASFENTGRVGDVVYPLSFD
jgi:hypothetical protein